MAFNIASGTENEDKPRKEVDWDALRAHTIEAAKTAARARSIPGIVAGIYDLGIQARPDAEEEFKGDEAAEAAEIAKNPNVYFIEKYGKYLMCRPQKPVQQVALAIDFPQILVDKGQFFGESNPMPLRLILNGEIQLNMLTKQEADKKTRVMAKGFSLVETKHPNGKWGFDKKNTLYKIADAAGLVGDDGIFIKKDIDKLLGKVVQFQIRVYNKPAKDGGKSYYTEEIKLAGIVPEGVSIPEAPEGILHMVQFSVENDEAALKQLRASVVNTMARAANFPGSKLSEQLSERLAKSAEYRGTGETTKSATEAPKPAVKAPKKAEVPADDPFDDEIPF